MTLEDAQAGVELLKELQSSRGQVLDFVGRASERWPGGRGLLERQRGWVEEV